MNYAKCLGIRSIHPETTSTEDEQRLWFCPGSSLLVRIKIAAITEKNVITGNIVKRWVENNHSLQFDKYKGEI